MREIYQMANFGEFKLLNFKQTVFLELDETHWADAYFNVKCSLTETERMTPIHQNVQEEI